MRHPGSWPAVMAIFFPFVLAAQCDTLPLHRQLAALTSHFETTGAITHPRQALSLLDAFAQNCPSPSAFKARRYGATGDLLASAEAFAAADSCYVQAIANCNTSPETLCWQFRRVDNFIAAQRYPQAEAVLAGIKDTLPGARGWFRATLQRATLALAQERPQLALAYLDKLKTATAAHPQSLPAFYACEAGALGMMARFDSIERRLELYQLAVRDNAAPASSDAVQLALQLLNTFTFIPAAKGRIPDMIQQIESMFGGLNTPMTQRWRCALEVEKIRIYQAQQQFPAALHTYTEALKCMDTTRLSHKLLLARAHQHVAQVYISLNLSQKGLELSRASNQALDLMPAPGRRLRAVNLVRIGQCYRALGALEYALDYLLEGYGLLKNILPLSGQGPFINQLIYVYGEKRDSAQTRYYLELYAACIQQTAKPAVLDQFTLGRNWFNFHVQFGRTEDAISVAEQTLRDCAGKVSNYYSKELELRLSHAYMEIKNYQKAYELAGNLADYFEQRRKQMGQTYSTEHYSWMQAVSAISAWHLFEASGDTVALHKSLERCEKSENALMALRNEHNEWPDIQRITDAYLYSGLVNLRLHFYQESGDFKHLERAFEIGEMSRMAHFQEYLNTANAIQFGDLTPEAATAERNLLIEISDLKSEQDKLFLSDASNKDSLENALGAQISERERAYATLLTSFKTRFPQYYGLKYSLSHLQLKDVQHKVLRPDETLLCYYYYNDELAILAIRPDTVVFSQQSMPPDAMDRIDSLNRWIADYPNMLKMAEADFANSMLYGANGLHETYRQLVQPIEGVLSEKVLIQPCDVLLYTPFEALLTQKTTQLGRPSAWDYWSNKKIMSYIQSATVFDLVQHRGAHAIGTPTVAAFAPFFDSDSTDMHEINAFRRFKGNVATPLPHSGEEAMAISRLFKGRAYIGSAANVESFAQQSTACDILHIATHASSGTELAEPSFLALRKKANSQEVSLLFADQIYQIPLHSDLVTLSACESGLGNYTESEGLQGLTRAFQCAGARNVVASLWTVSDGSTKALMVRFYREINAGYPYNEALARAKRGFIKENRQYGHPYYWAAFVLNGR